MNDLFLHHGRFHTLDRDGSVVDAVYIANDRIVALGEHGTVAAQVPGGCPDLDLGGRVALPGLIDAHAHIELASYGRDFWADVRGLGVAETVEALVEHRANRSGDAVLVGQATYGQELPGLRELDAAFPDTPVVIRVSMHLLQANSAALRSAGVARAFASPRGTRIERDADGTPTGWIEEGFDLFPIERIPVAELAPSLGRSALESFAQHGVTTVHELPASTAGVRSWTELAGTGDLPIRIVLNPILAPGHQPLLGSVSDYARLGLGRGIGDPMLRFGAIKIFLDGDEDAALTFEQLAGPPRDWGLVTQTFNDIVAALAECRANGIQAWVHAIGDAAQAMVLDAVEQVNRMHGMSDHRTRVEHLMNETFAGIGFDRVAELGVIPVPTAAFMHSEPAADDGSGMFPFRSMIEAGLRPPGNSDSAGTQPFATNPWFGIDCLMNRRNREGELLAPGEAIDLETALRMYTRYAAEATFEERDKGSIEAGKLGDLAVLEDDPFALPADCIGSVRTAYTIVGGRIAYARG